ncbi:MAG: tRNA (adenosine(37)-N6)-threonylcarbamoyltransferase complex dimerization subunit type 1 TsaB [Chloroflexi bacterium]|nr:tRNA (adenosine(37)-N6)-threonylcarbamoyltransferase complex dimerization subunit type 1 TsaB [Chloroflexota bacterium]MCI0889010.1 tRNA (adenosine(37)-N6)-threonylcarbamoyltransferase complex dimerization subunit type 1 TsaB [Chloroflexota bacterium]
MYLVIDTSTRHGAVGLWRDGALAQRLTWASPHNHTSELMPAVEAVLESAGAAPSDIRGIAVAHGPGGFSALRAGLGVAKGLAFALSVPAVGVSTLEATAYPHRDAGYPVCAVIEAGRELVAWARFASTDGGWARRKPDRVTPLDRLLAAAGRHTLFCGEGAVVHADALREAMGRRAHFAADDAPADRLAGVAELGARLLDRGEGTSPGDVQPHYGRPPTITRAKPPKAPRKGPGARTRQER